MTADMSKESEISKYVYFDKNILYIENQFQIFS